MKEREKRSKAAKKGWATRRKREREREEERARLRRRARREARKKKPKPKPRKAPASEALKKKRSLAAKKGHETRRRNERMRTPLGRAAEKLKWISRPKNYWAKRERADQRLDDIVDVAADEGVDVHELFGVLMSPEAA